MEHLQQLIESSGSPWVVALLLGVLFAIDPCPMLTNIAAMGYVAKEVGSPKKAFINGLIYTFGRAFAYGVLGFISIWLLRTGSSILHLEHFFGHYGEVIIIPFLIVIGVMLLFSEKLTFLRIRVSSQRAESKAGKGGWGSFILGAVLSLAFCPTNAILFFGILVPMSVPLSEGYIYPVLFSLSSSIPVLLVAWFVAYSLQSIGRVFDVMKQIEKWLKIGFGLFFIGLGLYFAIEHFIH